MPQSWLSPLAVRRPAGAKGEGVFAVEPIPAETTVAAFGGNVVDRHELHELDEAIRVHALQIDEELYLAGEPPFDDADYVNHSCEPNCGIVGSVLLVTMRDGRGRGRALLRLRDDRQRRLRRVHVLVRHRVVPRHDHRRRLEGTGAPRPVPRLALGLHRAPAPVGRHAGPAGYRRPGWTRASDSSRPSTVPPPTCRSTSRRCASPRTRTAGSTSTSGPAGSTRSPARCESATFDARPRVALRTRGLPRRPRPLRRSRELVPRLGDRAAPAASRSRCRCLMIAVGRRLGLDVRGVGMPGHFLVLDAARGDVWCDPVPRRRARSTWTVAGAASTSSTAGAGVPTVVPRADAPPAIVARMLANLERGELAARPGAARVDVRAAPRDPRHLAPGAVGARRPARGARAT